jgi:hypothetical protein
MVTEKRCFVCHKIKPISEFYKCKGMKDGHYGKCKECYREYAAKYREKNIERIREYDKSRANSWKRKELREAITKKRRKEVIGYQAAHSKIARAIKRGLLERPSTCEFCGKIGRVEAHHEDYNKPLEVIWLCPICHRNYHLGKGKNSMGIKRFVKTGARYEV